jgi:lipoprotein NlpD
MNSVPRSWGLWVVALLLAIGMAGCASRSGFPAPVEDRGSSLGRLPPPPPPSPASASRPSARPDPQTLPGYENTGKPGFYTVKPGDTLIRIGLDAGQNWRDLVRWNKIDNPNLLEVGQVLRVVSPDQTPAPEAVVIKPITAPTVVNAAGPDSKLATAAPPTPSLPSTGVAAGTPAASTPGMADSDGLTFIWPHNGTVTAGFDEAKNKGLDLAGKAGDPVLAAADGKVVYAGSGLRGYGNLVIIKHNNTFLSAYAHNQALLVREDQSVKRGQTIAQMGNSDADQVKLHFEIRRLGKPVDPVKFLPPR